MEPNKPIHGRRRLLKALGASSGVVVAQKSLPTEWAQPVVKSVLLPAHAQTTDPQTADCRGATYRYTGNTFDEFFTSPSLWRSSDRVTATIELQSVPIGLTNEIIPVLDWTVSDGLNTWTPGSPAGNGAQLRVTTNADGEFLAWEFGVSVAAPASPNTDFYRGVFTSSNGSGLGTDDTELARTTGSPPNSNQIDGARVRNNPGVWSRICR